MSKIAKNINAEIISSRKSKYWPIDPNKIPNMLDFFILKRKSFNYIEVLKLTKLTPNHVPVLLMLSVNVIH